MDGAMPPNGINYRRPSETNGMSLTEYSANPAPPVNTSPVSFQVPEHFLLPDGFPDVGLRLSRSCNPY